MEFNEKLRMLRKQKGLTQEELAKALFVSRAAVSKWESGRGYPSIDMLKQMASLFSVSLDELLSCEEKIISRIEREAFYDLIFGALDFCTLSLLFLPIFAQRLGNTISEVPLIELTTISPWLKIIYFVVILAMVVFGVLTFALQHSSANFWLRSKRILSVSLNVLGTLLFISSLQSYVAVFLFVLLAIKVLTIILKHRN